MPFFQRPLSKVLKIKKTVTLQVRIPLKYYGLPEKRVLSSASSKRNAVMSRRLKASLSVEAALVLSLYLFAAAILMAPMKMMNESRKIQTALEGVCEEVCQYAGLAAVPDREQEAFDNDEVQTDSVGNVVPEKLVRNLTEAGIKVYAERKIRQLVGPEKAGNFSFSETEFLNDGETVDLILHYQMYLPFPVFRIKGIPMTARSCRRAWIGKRGGTESSNSGGDPVEETVYVGKSSTKYHRNRECHYLFNDISVYPFEAIDTLRNSDGKRYRPCARCGSMASAGGKIYVMPSGETYHSDRSCSSIVAYVRAVPLSEVAYLGPCSYCAQ